jgi:two-component system, OmpR family, KDP operon response regulator KdpE
MKPNPIILLIDADKPTRKLLQTVLEVHRYRVFEAESGETGIKEAVARRPDVIVMDLSLPDMDGMALLKQLREWYRAPILILSARDTESAKVSALDGGANDFVSKPFGTAEVLARLRVLQRWDPASPEGPYYINGDLRVNVTAGVITIRGRHIELTPTEEALFFTLVRHAGHLVTRSHLLRCVWGADSESKLHDLHVYIRNLRNKLQGATEEVLIQTEGSEGYRLVVPFGTGKISRVAVQTEVAASA